MRDEEDEDDKEENPPTPRLSSVTSHQSPVNQPTNQQPATSNQQPTIDKRNAKIDWSQS